MGSFDKYKKSQDNANLDKYKKASGKSFDEIEKDLEKKEAVKTEAKPSQGGTILIIVLGVIAVLVWVMAIGKLMK